MAGERWLFTKTQLSTSPSRKHGIDSDKELSYRQQAANLIQDMGQRLQVNQLTINTAIVYMHRFYVFQSFTRFHRNSMAPACLFLAAKVEEQPRKLEHVIKVAYLCLHRESPHLDPKSETYLELAQELVVNENILLQTLGFEVTVDHPHIHVVNTCELVRAPRDLAQTCYFLATNSLHLTTLCLQQKPAIVALVCIHLACKWSGWKIPKSAENKDWFSYVDKEITLEKLEGLAQDFLQILDKCPNRLKRKIMGGKSAPKDGASSEAGQSSDRGSTSVKDLLANDMQSVVTGLTPPQTEHPELSEKSMFDSPTTSKPITPPSHSQGVPPTAAASMSSEKHRKDKSHGLSYEEYVKRKGRDSIGTVPEKDKKPPDHSKLVGGLPRHSMSCSDLSRLEKSESFKHERLNIFTKMDSNMRPGDRLEQKLKLEIDASLKANLHPSANTDTKHTQHRDQHPIPESSRTVASVQSPLVPARQEAATPQSQVKVKQEPMLHLPPKSKPDLPSPLSSKVKQAPSPQSNMKIRQELTSPPPAAVKIKSEFSTPVNNTSKVKPEFTTPPNSGGPKLKLEMPTKTMTTPQKSPQITSKVSPDVPSPHIRVKIPPLDPSYELKMSASRSSVSHKEDLVSQSAHAAKTKHSSSSSEVPKHIPGDPGKLLSTDNGKHTLSEAGKHATPEMMKRHHHGDKKSHSHSHSDSGLKMKIKTGDGDKHYHVKSEHKHKGEHKSPKLHIKIGRPSPSAVDNSLAVKADPTQASSPLKLKIKVDKRDKHSSVSATSIDSNAGHKGELKLRISTSQLGSHMTKHDDGRSGHRESSRKSHSKERHLVDSNSVDSVSSHHRKRPHSPERDAVKMRPSDNKHARTGNRSRRSSNASSHGVVDMDVCTTPTDLLSPEIVSRDVEANGSHTSSPHALTRTESTENLSQLKMKLEQIIEQQKTNLAQQRDSPILPNVPPPPPPPLLMEKTYGYDSVKKFKGQSAYQPPLPPSETPPPPPPPPPL